jgi:hypothetical protein
MPSLLIVAVRMVVDGIARDDQFGEARPHVSATARRPSAI